MGRSGGVAERIPGAGASGAAPEQRPAEAKGVERARAALPVRIDLHVRLQVDSGTEQCLELQARLSPGLFQHRAVMTDDYALLRVALDSDHRTNRQDRSVRRLSLLDLVYADRDRVGQLVVGQGKELLPHDLRRE